MKHLISISISSRDCLPDFLQDRENGEERNFEALTAPQIVEEVYFLVCYRAVKYVSILWPRSRRAALALAPLVTLF